MSKYKVDVQDIAPTTRLVVTYDNETPRPTDSFHGMSRLQLDQAIIRGAEWDKGHVYVYETEELVEYISTKFPARKVHQWEVMESIGAVYEFEYRAATRLEIARRLGLLEAKPVFHEPDEVTCEECKTVVLADDDQAVNEAGTYHDECYQTVTERSKP